MDKDYKTIEEVLQKSVKFDALKIRSKPSTMGANQSQYSMNP